MASETRIDGVVSDQFEQVRSVFAENFEKRGEIGAAVAVYIDGPSAVDLWGGVTVRNGENNGAWERDTLVCMLSVNKSVTAICAHRLADQGKLDYEAPVAHYWPELPRPARKRLPCASSWAVWPRSSFPMKFPRAKSSTGRR